ncbi:MAG: hypothetical protein HRT65_13930 [Flavobacteriaceae bacterium]|nr:hypothetical protein [Flavobacteriaceae bacterium]
MRISAILNLFNKYFGAIFCLILALLFFYIHINKPKLRGEEDLMDVSGKLESYSFKDNTGWKKNGRRYVFRLENYSNEFQISANHLTFFDKSGFKTNAAFTPELSVKIMKDQKDLLNSSNERVLAISINDAKTEYLNSKNVILKEQGPGDLIMGFGLIIAGFLAFVVKYKNLT